MFTLITDFLKNHWLGALACTVVAGFLATFCLEHMEIGHLRNRLAEAQAENVTLARANRALTVSVENQNAMILAWQADAAARAKKAAAALASATDDARRFEAMAKRLARAGSAADACSDAHALVDRYIDDMK